MAKEDYTDSHGVTHTHIYPRCPACKIGILKHASNKDYERALANNRTPVMICDSCEVAFSRKD